MDTAHMLRVNQVISKVENEGKRMKYTYHLHPGLIEYWKKKGYKSIEMIHIFKGKNFEVKRFNIENIPLSDTVYISDEIRDKYSIQKGDDIITHLKKFII